MFWVVCYDIPDDKRRAKVSKLLEGYGRRVQDSVFECDIEDAKMQRLEKRMRVEIEPTQDDVRFYPLNRADVQRARLLGRATLTVVRPYVVVERE